MKIIIEGPYKFHNFGDVGMMVAAIYLLKKNCDAEIRIITEQPEKAKKIFPDVKYLLIKKPDPRLRSEEKLFPSLFFKYLPSKHHVFLEGLEVHIFRLMPEKIERAIKYLNRISDRDFKRSRIFCEIIDSDLVMLSGAGMMTDAFYKHAKRALKTLSTAAEAGITTAILGQGLGPIRNQKMYSFVRSNLHLLDLIALRENTHSPELLKDFGIEKRKVRITGDDAILLSFPKRRDTIGRHIGISLRIASYASIDKMTRRKIKELVINASKINDADLVSLPILVETETSDTISIRNLFGEYERFRDIDIEIYEIEKFLTLFHHCRVVVTGSYHAGVFSLSQGIPVVALARSEYYKYKFEGLAGMFPDGCTIIPLYENNFGSIFQASLKDAWEGAPYIKEKLLKMAKRQIEQTERAYKEIVKIVRQKKKGSND